MVAIGVGAVASWLGYTLIQRHYLNQGDFLAMQLLAETRQPDGDMASMIPKLSLLPTVSELPKSVQILGGDKDSSDDDDASADSPIYQCGESLYCRPSRNQTSYSLFGYRPRTSQSLRQLAQRHTRLFKVYEDIETRYGFMKGIREAKTLEPTVVNASSILKGVYTFCFRDYVNFEEMLGMMIRRKGIELLLFRLLDSTKLIVDEESKCQMTDSGLFLLFIPLAISWYGTLEPDRINWTSTSMRLGWKRFGKTFLNPTAAEKLRQDPWVVRLPKEDYPLWEGSGDVVVLDRLKSGSLVFCRDECLTPL